MVTRWWKLGRLAMRRLKEAVAASGQSGFMTLYSRGPMRRTIRAVERSPFKGGFSIWWRRGLGRSQVDVFRLHYDHLKLVSATGSDLSLAYEPIRNRVAARRYAAFLAQRGRWARCRQRAIKARKGRVCSSPTTWFPKRLGRVGDNTHNSSRPSAARCNSRSLADGKSPPSSRQLVAKSVGHGFDDLVVLAPSARSGTAQ
jgi:hypothetical protein